MDSAKIWVYLIIGGVYIVSRLIKQGTKKVANPPKPTQNVTGMPEPAKKQPIAATFEELLREITESKRPPSQRPVIDYDDQIGEEERDLEDVNYDYRKDSEVVATYEEAKRQAFVRPSLEETMKVSDTVVSFGKFKEFESSKQTDVAAEFLKDFTNVESLKKAVVMSEILKTKF